jgi:protein Tex
MSDLTPGMELRGTVLNVVDFGAFVDVGLKESGLVHVSEMSTQFIRSPHDVVSVGDVVTVWVLSVDADRKRVSLGMIKPGTPLPARGRRPDRKPVTAPQPAPTSPVANAEASVDAAASMPPPLPAAASKPKVEEALVESPAPDQPAKPRHPPKRPHHQNKERKPPPLSTGALSGQEPLRTFGQLKQFWNKKSP